MKPLAIGIRLLLGSFLVGFFGCTMAAPLFQPNVAQIDEANQGYYCPPVPQNEAGFTNIPNFVLTMETFGNPVQVSFTTRVSISTSSAVSLRPVIDGRVPGAPVRPDAFYLYFNSGANQGMDTTLSMSRVFTVSKGVHTFGVQASCQGMFVNLGVRWLTVYELGSAVPKSDG
ncbi:hypothetical protein ACFOFO_20650, partial [Undibacterium arcticum]